MKLSIFILIAYFKVSQYVVMYKINVFGGVIWSLSLKKY